MSDRVALQLEPQAPSVMAGGQSLPVTVTVRNTSDVVDTYDLRLEGIPDGWFTLSEPSVSLFPGERQQVVVTFHPPRREDVVAGDYPVVFTATSQDNPAEVTSETLSLTIRPSGSFDLRLERPSAAGRKGQYRLSIASLSDGALTLALRASDAAAALRIDLSQERVALEPYRERGIPFVVKPKKGRLVGEPERHAFVVEATPEMEDHDEALRQTQQVQGEFVHKPLLRQWPWAPLPAWAKIALLTLLPLGLLAATLLALVGADVVDIAIGGGGPEPRVEGGRPSALPVVRSFTLAPQPDGSGFRLSWDVGGATKIELNGKEVSSTEVALPEGAEGQYSLSAENEAGQVSAAFAVPVRNAPLIKKFTATPSRLEAGDKTTLAWIIAGATSAEIERLDSGGTTMTEITQGELEKGDREETLQVPTVYTLTAENDVGYSSVALVVDVTQPPPDGAPVIKKFTAAPASLGSGDTTELQWEIENATRASVNRIGDPESIGISQDELKEGKRPETLQETTAYLLTAENGAGSSYQTLVVNVAPLPCPPCATSTACPACATPTPCPERITPTACPACPTPTPAPTPLIQQFLLPEFFTVGTGEGQGEVEITYETLNADEIVVVGAYKVNLPPPSGVERVRLGFSDLNGQPVAATFPVVMLAVNSQQPGPPTDFGIAYSTGVPPMEIWAFRSVDFSCRPTLQWTVSGDPEGTVELLRYANGSEVPTLIASFPDGEGVGAPISYEDVTGACICGLDECYGDRILVYELKASNRAGAATSRRLEPACYYTIC